MWFSEIVLRVKGVTAVRKARRAILWAALCAVLALICLTPRRGAESRREALLRGRYGGWSGVLRLWTVEGWSCGGGSLVAWLNEAASAFEKAHGGVYIQLTEVSAEALQNFAGGTASPPDMILFPPGLLDSPAALCALPDEYPLREGLQGCGAVGESRFAVPVAMGAVGIAWNRAAMERLPAAWNRLPDAPSLPGCAYWLDWPADGPYCRWSRAMGDLLAPAPENDAAPPTPRAGEGLDLGLSAAAEAPLPGRLPADFGQSESVYRRFVNGEIAAMPVTQREIDRLRLLSEGGRGPDWAVAARAGGYIDQLALLAVTDCCKSDQAARQALCFDFAARLVSAETQERLKRARAFPVIDLPPLYAGIEGMAQLEAGLNAASILPAPAFGGS